MRFRTHYLIQPKFQLLFSALLIVIALVAAILVGIAIYKLIETNNFIFVKYNVHATPEFLNLLAKERQVILISWVLSFLSVALILLCVGIFLSHKMAGPLFALTREMNKLKTGDLTAHLELRKRDEFAELKKPFNLWVDAMKKMAIQDISKIDQLLQALSKMIQNMQDQKIPDSEISDIQRLISTLEKIKETKENQLEGNATS